MKKVLLLLVVLLGFSTYSMAQGYTEVVYLKSGTVLRGLIVELVPNVSIKIKTDDGSVFVYRISDVEKITREEYSKSKGKQQKQQPTVMTYQEKPKEVKQQPAQSTVMEYREKPKDYQEAPREYERTRSTYQGGLKGYKGFFDSGYTMDISDAKADKIEISTAHGYQFNNHFFLGVGAAASYYYDADVICAPVFTNFRVNFINKRITPFADVKLGYTVGDLEGMYGSTAIGVRFGLGKKIALNLSLEYNIQQVTNDYEYNYYYDSDYTVEGLGIKFGFEF